VRDFTDSYAELPGAPEGAITLRLVPRKPDPEIEWLMLAVDPDTLQIRQLVALDRQGGRSTFTFTNIKENRQLSDKLFEFRVPRGVDVITKG
jgi:outer membrane lipoprotein carrier protein